MEATKLTELDIINGNLALKTCGTYKTAVLVDLNTGKELGRYTYCVGRPEELERIKENLRQAKTIEGRD